MVKHNHIRPFMRELFGARTRTVETASRVVSAILAARSGRLSHIAAQMGANYEANYKQLNRFLNAHDALPLLHNLFDEDAPYVIGDVTEVARPDAKNTEYVGVLSDGKTRGFWVLMLGMPYRGRVLPSGYIVYSSHTINEALTSRNLEHERALDQLAAYLGDKPLLLDREFGYQGLLHGLLERGCRFVIRVRMNGQNAPHFTDSEGRRIVPTVAREHRAYYHNVLYRGQLQMNLAGVWLSHMHEPIWLVTNLPAE